MATNTHSTASTDWWTSIRTTAFFDAAAGQEPEPEQLDPADVELADWSEHRAEMGLGSYDGSGDFVNLGADQSGLPDWRRPTMPEQVEFTDLDRHAEDRAAAGIPDLNDFGLPAGNPRSNASPWQAV